MEIKADEFKWLRDDTGGWLCVKCSHPDQILGSIKEGKKYTVSIKEYRKKRSLDANAYFWVLADKLAEHQTMAKERPVTKQEIYRSLIKEIPGVSVILCVQNEAVSGFCRNWEAKGAGWQAVQTESKIPGCTNIIAYYGSSTYDTKQMGMLISAAVAECEDAGIPTLSEQQISKMLDVWDRNYGGK